MNITIADAIKIYKGGPHQGRPYLKLTATVHESLRALDPCYSGNGFDDYSVGDGYIVRLVHQTWLTPAYAIVLGAVAQ